jgi:5-oxopent-3-ene-1,2,5-tricarboxylate decarboxylase/2-hydroxyhepta-2,4-diene-1,7-dioate isomerase
MKPSMFSVTDHLVHIEGEPLPRDVDAAAARTLTAGSTRCRPPVSGAVYGTLLNDRAAVEALGEAVNAPPYKAPPRAPILYVKPRNTLVGHGACVAIPDQEGVEIGVSLGIVVGRTANRVSVHDALEYVAGYTLVADLSVPHVSVYRPSVRFRARDGFCVIGPTVVAKRHIADPQRLTLNVALDEQSVFNANTSTCVRSVAQLLADVTDFMTLSPGDVITLGVPHGAPVVSTNTRATLAIDDWAPLRIDFVASGAASAEEGAQA